jgi:excisionase family DNA binding protein
VQSWRATGGQAIAKPTLNITSNTATVRFRSVGPSAPHCGDQLDAAVVMATDEKKSATPFLTVELASRWKVNPRTIRRMVENGKLRAVRIGPQLRIPVDVIERSEARHAEGDPEL